MATGIVQASFVLSRVREQAPLAPAFLRWHDFARSPGGLLVWEAFVTGNRKTDSHVGDAQAGVQAFVRALPAPDDANAVQEDRVLSLIGAALLRTGWNVSEAILQEPCLVIRSDA